MRFLLDESVEYRIATFLENEDHDVRAIAHDYPGAVTDRQVLEIARDEQRVLITNDRDFGELVFRHGLTHAGIILFRLPSGGTDAKIERLRRLLVTHGDRLAEFVVVNPRNVRVRTVARK